MIYYLRGDLVQALPNQVTVDVHGVGYLILVPLSTYDALPAVGTPIRLLTHLVIREDAHLLYGFLKEEERDLFRLLIQRVSGVGPKTALAVLGALSVHEFKATVVRGDADHLAKVKGLGKKTAERIILELKDKVGVTDVWEQAAAEPSADSSETSFNDAVLALINLGYNRSEALKVVGILRKSASLGAETTADEIVRAALRLLN